MKRTAALLCALLLLLSGYAPTAAPRENELVILATTYPVYLLTCAVVQDVDGVRVERLNTGSVSCVHDYTLSVSDMKKIEQADILALSGAGLEDFMGDALAASSAAVIDCSAGVELLVSADHAEHEHEHEHHEHDHGHFDPHYWLDPANAAHMTQALLDGLLPRLSANAPQLTANAQRTRALLLECSAGLHTLRAQTDSLPGLITFHDGFAYLARACGVTVLRAIEEEAGSEASARDIVEVSALVREQAIPLVFTEINGSDATARVIARETGCALGQLSTLMDGPAADKLLCSPEQHYVNEILTNAASLVNGLAGREVVSLP